MTTNSTGQDTEFGTVSDQFGILLKKAMEQKSLSLRQLSRNMGVSAPTLSRIVSGKQAAGVHHLQLLAEHLDLSMEDLLTAMGVPNMKQPAHSGSAVLGTLKDIFADFSVDFESLTGDVQKELNKLEQYARTKEGNKTILESFGPKLHTLDGMGPIINKLHRFYELFTAPGTPEECRAVVGSALLYFISTVEVIPDYLYPIGHLDDAFAIILAEKKLLSLTQK